MALRIIEFWQIQYVLNAMNRPRGFRGIALLHTVQVSLNYEVSKASIKRTLKNLSSKCVFK